MMSPTEPPSAPVAPLVSIVLPVLNGARYLDAAIESVRAQSLDNWELLCIDDGSTDATPAIFARHAAADPRVRHLTNARNIGLPATLNRGFAAARGELHSWTSHDNLLAPTMLERLVAALDATPRASVAYAAYWVIDAAGDVVRTEAARPIADRFVRNVVGAAFLYRAEVCRTLGGYDETLFGAEDYDFWLRAARRFEFVAIDEPLYRYRRHAESLTDRRSDDIKDKVVAIVRRELAMVADPKLTATALVHLALSHGRWRGDLVAEAVRADPRVTLRHAVPLARHRARLLWRG